jgi:hypothetical protein
MKELKIGTTGTLNNYVSCIGLAQKCGGMCNSFLCPQSQFRNLAKVRTRKSSVTVTVTEPSKLDFRTFATLSQIWIRRDMDLGVDIDEDANMDMDIDKWTWIWTLTLTWTWT